MLFWLTLLLILYTTYFYLRKDPLAHIPGPRFFPLIGSIYALSVSDPLESLYTLSKKFGSVFRMRLGHLDIVYVTDHKVAAEMTIKRPMDFDRSVFHDVTAQMFGKYSVEVIHNADWRPLRELVDVGFKSSQLNRFMPLMVEKSVKLVEVLKDYEEIDMVPYFQYLSLDCNTQFTFGCKDSSLDQNGSDLGHAMSFQMAHYTWRSLFHTTFQYWKYWDSPGEKKYRQSEEVFQRMITEAIEEKKGLSREELENGYDLLSKMLLADADMEIIRDTLKTMIIAGDTTPAGLTWTLYHLMLSPEWQEKIREEIFSTVGMEPIASVDQLKGLELLDVFIKETFRLHPPVSAFWGRKAMKDFNANGTFIPKGTTVAICSYAVHRNITPDQPEEFKPERWLSGHFNPTTFTFAAGRRNCVGGKFAQMEMKCALATLLQHYRFRLPSGYKPEMEISFVVYPTHLPVSIEKLHK
eukprot:TRINITY_DN46_c3_g1_i1.p1 TRINITY_DN46_c3_g1~~TRINITY_DN46_c3_g1_i1.p1  ORF type:complete len:466 (-),score=74.76 TRINITY_DN46_c3_g1_i1:36-1433(-)